MLDRRLLGIPGLFAWIAVVSACASEAPGPADTANGGTKSDTFVGRPTKDAPKSVAECEELTKPTPDCHWTIAAPVYCGGPVPPPGMFVAGCACVTCTEDAHCNARSGGRCATLQTNEACNAARAVCVYPEDPCYDEKAPRCAKGEQCIADGGVAHCGVFVPEPPRP